MLTDGNVTKDEVKDFYNQAKNIFRNASVAVHPLSAVAQYKRQAAAATTSTSATQTLQRLITLEWLTEWLARKVNLHFYRIDPLEIDFTKVVDIMSTTYATRFNILLPVELTITDLVISTAEPFCTEWKAEIIKSTHCYVRLVIG